VPVDGVLMQLGRAYRLAGRTPEAVQTFKRITDEFPASPYAADARRELDVLTAGA
jgi:outer membrane protein assembly factor BamD (BamD/ComL family)